MARDGPRHPEQGAGGVIGRQELAAPGIGAAFLEMQIGKNQGGMRARKSRTLVAEAEGEIVGFVIAGLEPKNLGHLITIDVAPHRQRQQIGSRLLEEIEGWLWQHGAEAIYLETPIDDAGARGFYDKHGYFVLEQIAGYYNGTLDALVMMKTTKH